jgi:hypothetical protein
MMGDDPKKIAMLIMGKDKGEGGKEDAEAEEGESSTGADAFAEAVSLAKSGDKMGAYEALKVAVASCQGADD